MRRPRRELHPGIGLCRSAIVIAALVGFAVEMGLRSVPRPAFRTVCSGCDGSGRDEAGSECERCDGGGCFIWTSGGDFPRRIEVTRRGRVLECETDARRFRFGNR